MNSEAGLEKILGNLQERVKLLKKSYNPDDLNLHFDIPSRTDTFIIFDELYSVGREAWGIIQVNQSLKSCDWFYDFFLLISNLSIKILNDKTQKHYSNDLIERLVLLLIEISQMTTNKEFEGDIKARNFEALANLLLAFEGFSNLRNIAIARAEEMNNPKVIKFVNGMIEKVREIEKKKDGKMSQKIFVNSVGVLHELSEMILQVLDVNQYDPDLITAFWSNETSYDDVKGVLAIVEFNPELYIAVLNLPVIIMPVYGKILNLADMMQLLSVLSEIPTGQFALKDNILYFTLCLPLHQFEQQNIPAIFNSLMNGVEEIRKNLFVAIRSYYNIKTPKEWTYPEPVLPNIKMTPTEMRVINNILSNCDREAQEIFTVMAEKWVRAGYIVTTTSQAIVLDVPYGDRTARLAMLFPGVSEELAALYPDGHARLPGIALFWESLRKYQGFPSEAVDIYQKSVMKITTLRLTEASAQIELNDQFSLKTSQGLLKAMKILAKCLRPELIKEPETYGPVTPDNIQSTLDSCSKHIKGIYMELIAAWRLAGGIIQCPRPGRIYLKMKTKAHRSGEYAQLSRKFNLVVLAGPRGKKIANMQVEWNLSRYYLDCIPAEAERFEKTVTTLPGFERKGTITYLWVDENFQMADVQLLSKAMISLKKAEQAAI